MGKALRFGSRQKTRTTAAASQGPRVWRWECWGASLGVLATLLWQWPAAWATPWISGATHRYLQLADVRGSIWDGSAVLILSGGEGARGSRALDGRLAWHLRPAWGSGGPALALSVAQDRAMPVPASLRVDRDGLHLGSLQATVPAAWLAGMGTPWNTLDLQGALSLGSDGLDLSWASDRLALSGGVRVRARQMSSRLSPVRPLGSFDVTLQGHGDTAALSLSTTSGPMRLQGQGQWFGHRLRFRGTGRADPGYEQGLDQLLRLIGRMQGSITQLEIG